MGIRIAESTEDGQTRIPASLHFLCSAWLLVLAALLVGALFVPGLVKGQVHWFGQVHLLHPWITRLIAVASFGLMAIPLLLTLRGRMWAYYVVVAMSPIAFPIELSRWHVNFLGIIFALILLADYRAYRSYAVNETLNR